MIASIIDQLVQLAVMLAVVIALFAVGAIVLGATGWQPSSIGDRLRGNRAAMRGFAAIVGLAIILAFLITIGYYIFFEMVWNGQSPGKRAAGIRVLSAGGTPITFGQSLVRNLVRPVDMLPTSYMLGLTVMILNRRSQRLGDIAAGTVVVKIQREASPRLLGLRGRETSLPPQLAARIQDEDVALARDFLLRRRDLPPARREELARRIAARLRSRLGPQFGDDAPEMLIERLATARR
jgi:uncharacterized RDD family membrane protein YckC